MTRCVAHGVEWTGLNACHCEACGRTFTGPTGFDRHRSGPAENRRCVTPRGYIEVKPGVLGLPGPESGSFSRRDNGTGHA